MSGAAQRALRRAARSASATSPKKSTLPKKKTVSRKKTAKNAATPTKPPTPPMTTPNQTEPVAQDPAVASSSDPPRPIEAQANQNAASTPALPLQHTRKDSSRQNITQSIETVLPESSTSAARKSLLANEYSKMSSNVSPPMRPASFVSATPSPRSRDQEKTPVSYYAFMVDVIVDAYS
jgi:hypothetical protein